MCHMNSEEIKNNSSKYGITTKVGVVVIFFFCISTNSTIINSDTFFVDNVSGNNNNAGTRSDPWSKIDYGLKKLRPGDTLYITNNGSTKPYREVIIPAVSGVRNNHIIISGADPSSKPSVIGSEDWSDQQAGGHKKWLGKKDGVLILADVPQPAAVWVSTVAEWKNTGVDGLSELEMVASGVGLKHGEWSYSKATNSLTYRLKPGESVNSLHFEAVIEKVLLKKA